jgi:hypothetical protein
MFRHILDVSSHGKKRINKQDYDAFCFVRLNNNTELGKQTKTIGYTKNVLFSYIILANLQAGKEEFRCVVGIWLVIN